MTIATIDQLVAAARQQLRFIKTAAVTTVATQPFTTLDTAGNPGAGSLTVGNTVAGVVPTDALAGFPAINAFGVGATGYLQAVDYGCSVACRLTLFDRLFQAGSFSLASLTTFNLTGQPSYAGRLPGGGYEGLEIFLEVNAAIAASAVTIVVGYTREDGTQGRSTVVTPSLASFTTRRLIPLALAAGDKGVQQIDSVTVGGVAAASGTINVIVARRLWTNRVRLANDGGLDSFDATGLPVVYEDSALWLVTKADSTSGGLPELLMTIANG